MKLKKLTIAITLIAGAVPLASLAESNTVQLDKVIVTGALYEQPLDKTLTNVSIINRSGLDKNHAHDLKSSIRYEPGVIVNSDITRYGNSGFNIRGIEGNRIVTMVDGVRMNNGYVRPGHDSANVVSRGGIEFDTIRQMDIVKGPYSALYGNDALGGAVNFNTWQPSDLVSADKPYYIGFKQSYNSQNSGRASTLGAAGKAGVVSGLVMFTKRDSKETKNSGKIGGIGPERTKPNPLDVDAYNILSKVTIGDGAHKVNLSGEYFDQQRKTNMLTALGMSRGSTVLVHEGKDKLKRKRFGTEYSYRVNEGIIRGLSASYAYHQTTADNTTNKLVKGPGPAPAKSSQEFFSYDQTSHMLRTQMNAVIEQNVLSHNIVAGAEYRTDVLNPNQKIFEHKTTPKSEQNNLEIYVLDEMQFNNGFTITPALRYSHYSMKPKHDSEYINTNPNTIMAKKMSDSKVSPSLSFKMPIGDADTAFLAFSTGFKSPPIQAMNAFSFGHGGPRSFKVTYIPNQNLKSETSKSAELGWRHHGENWQAKVTTYYNRYNNFIDEQMVSGGVREGFINQSYVNKDKVKTYGIEMATAYRFDNHITLASGFSWMKGKAGDEKLDTAQPPKLTLGVGYEKEQWGVNMDVSLVRPMSFERVDRASGRKNSIQVPGYGIADLTAYWKVHKNVKLTAGVYNIADKKYWHTSDIKFNFNNNSYPDSLYTQPGRSFAATVKVDF